MAFYEIVNFWGLYLCTISGCGQVLSPISDLVPGWQHLAATYQAAPEGEGQIVIHRNAVAVGRGMFPGGQVRIIYQINPFRWVASLLGGGDEFALRSEALGPDDIETSYTCGVLFNVSQPHEILSGKRKRKLKNITIKIDPLQVKAIKKLSTMKSIPYQSLIRSWLAEGIKSEMDSVLK